ncbi:hypothetical protein [Actinophytocola sp.]|uniref:hypothetical protein n=1 Tax=Actinophytocola sp. TaxID=1872138 RepID=UPI002D4178A8|nr:hypothetical protein [Actinophytocola sp.]HYQ68531.1 hypothetical protein [Actinophytocola sp.]
MAQRGPLVTAVVVVGGLVGLMTANAAGGLVSAGGPAPSPTRVGATQTEKPPTTTEPPVETTTPPAETTTQPPKTEAPPAQQFPAEAVYAGETADLPLYIALAVKGEEASAYLCDGKTVESWLKGTARNGTVDLTSKDGANTLNAKLEGNTLVGSIMLAGQPHDFSIPLAPPPAGLYRGANGDTNVGWIVLPSGKQVGVARTGSRASSAPPLGSDRKGATVGGAFVSAVAVTGATKFG